MLNHVVLLKFKPGVSNSEIEALEKMLDDLPNKITEIHAYELGRDVTRSEKSYDFALVSLFANTIALERYQQHRQHEGSDAGSIDTERPIWEFKPI
jgi:hypothetical protein